jgi:hypothetical protein
MHSGVRDDNAAHLWLTDVNQPVQKAKSVKASRINRIFPNDPREHLNCNRFHSHVDWISYNHTIIPT